MATLPNCGKVLRASNTTLTWKHVRGTLLIAGSNGNKFEDWKTRSNAPNSEISKDTIKETSFFDPRGNVQRLDASGSEKISYLR